MTPLPGAPGTLRGVQDPQPAGPPGGHQVGGLGTEPLQGPCPGIPPGEGVSVSPRGLPPSFTPGRAPLCPGWSRSRLPRGLVPFPGVLFFIPGCPVLSSGGVPALFPGVPVLCSPGVLLPSRGCRSLFLRVPAPLPRVPFSVPRGSRPLPEAPVPFPGVLFFLPGVPSPFPGVPFPSRASSPLFPGVPFFIPEGPVPFLRVPFPSRGSPSSIPGVPALFSKGPHSLLGCSPLPIKGRRSPPGEWPWGSPPPRGCGAGRCRHRCPSP